MCYLVTPNSIPAYNTYNITLSHLSGAELKNHNLSGKMPSKIFHCIPNVFASPPPTESICCPPAVLFAIVISVLKLLINYSIWIISSLPHTPSSFQVNQKLKLTKLMNSNEANCSCPYVLTRSRTNTGHLDPDENENIQWTGNDKVMNFPLGCILAGQKGCMQLHPILN